MRYFILIFISFVSLLSYSQSRGGNVYEFLDLPTSARGVALGGNQALIGVEDVCHLLINPAQQVDSLGSSLGLNVCPMPDDVIYGSMAAAYNWQGFGRLGIGAQFIDYGDFTDYNEYEVEMGEVHAREVAVYLSYARNLMPRLTAGATFKPIFSHLADYHSFGLAMDMGIYYKGKMGRFAAAAVLRNLGGQITTYDEDGDHESLSTDLSLGANYRPEHAPFRISCTIDDIFHWDLSPDRSNSISFADNFMRHVILGVEFVPAKAFWFGMGYNQRQRKELRETNAGGAAGISWGAGLCIKNIHIDYGHGRYHLAGSSNSISISFGLFERFMK